MKWMIDLARELLHLPDKPAGVDIGTSIEDSIEKLRAQKKEVTNS